MAQKIGYVALIVRDYDEGLSYFTRLLGLELIEDTPLGDDKRWVLIAPSNSQGTCLLLARAVTAEQSSRIGNQTGGHVFLFLHTDDFWRDYTVLRERGVVFQQPPARSHRNSGRFRRSIWQSLGSFAIEGATQIM